MCVYIYRHTERYHYLRTTILRENTSPSTSVTCLWLRLSKRCNYRTMMLCIHIYTQNYDALYTLYIFLTCPLWQPIHLRETNFIIKLWKYLLLSDCFKLLPHKRSAYQCSCYRASQSLLPTLLFQDTRELIIFFPPCISPELRTLLLQSLSCSLVILATHCCAFSFMFVWEGASRLHEALLRSAAAVFCFLSLS